MNKKPIIAIGGMGGSGTRLLAELLQWAGVNIGRDLKISNRFRILIKILEERYNFIPFHKIFPLPKKKYAALFGK